MAVVRADIRVVVRVDTRVDNHVLVVITAILINPQVLVHMVVQDKVDLVLLEQDLAPLVVQDKVDFPARPVVAVAPLSWQPIGSSPGHE
ncbi:hypothetical protein KDW_33340 [Dictyobacter vulcani]|uniref:Uncharacterized protein n=2 Tax=Dictyobacter vulcani TaxID=2607529 RepID=A0A5J4KPR2_9CHLR|nr:hypothetical protein KDW_33340 [Dictyobacter vulcani]